MPYWFVALSAVIGFLQVVDGLHLWRRRGYFSGAALVFSVVELVWFGLCLWIAYKIWALPDSQVWLPMLYLFYVVVVNAVWVVYKKDSETTDVLPRLGPGVVCLSIGFGVVFCLSSLFLLWSVSW